MYETIQHNALSVAQVDLITQVVSLGAQLKKMARKLIDVQRASQQGEKALRKAKAKAYAYFDKVQKANREAAAENTVSPAVSQAVNKVADSILADFKKNGPSLKVYKWMADIADAIPDEELPDKAKLLKRCAKAINDLDEDDEIDDEDIDRILSEHEPQRGGND